MKSWAYAFRNPQFSGEARVDKTIQRKAKVTNTEVWLQYSKKPRRGGPTNSQETVGIPTDTTSWTTLEGRTEFIRQIIEHNPHQTSRRRGKVMWRAACRIRLQKHIVQGRDQRQSLQRARRKNRGSNRRWGQGGADPPSVARVRNRRFQRGVLPRVDNGVSPVILNWRKCAPFLCLEGKGVPFGW